MTWEEIQAVNDEVCIALGIPKCETCARAYHRHFATSWSDAGPLIEQYKISLEYNETRKDWCAVAHHGECVSDFCSEESPLLAVCGVILALGEEGLL